MPSRGLHGNDSPASLNAHVPQNHYSALIFPILEQRTRWVHRGNSDPSGPQVFSYRQFFSVLVGVFDF
ncbi:hypothetical protein TNCV_4407761 [Trichonephila clavipes]|nr:hypothetical protein TNCV_4407761 [Trichonephila clavipes]